MAKVLFDASSHLAHMGAAVSGSKIIAGLQDAVAGNLARVTIGDQTWIRAKGGRPPISETKIALLRGAFERGHSTTKAAKECGVHRNTAISYFTRFKKNAPMLERGEGKVSDHSLKLRDYIWSDLAKAAKSRNMSTPELASFILTAVVEDDLFAAVLVE